MSNLLLCRVVHDHSVRRESGGQNIDNKVNTIRETMQSCSEVPPSKQQGQGDHIKYLLFNFFQKDGVLHDSTARRVCGREAQGDRQFCTVILTCVRLSLVPGSPSAQTKIFLYCKRWKAWWAWKRGYEYVKLKLLFANLNLHLQFMDISFET